MNLHRVVVFIAVSISFLSALVFFTGCKGQLGGGAPLSALPNNSENFPPVPSGTSMTQNQTANTQIDLLMDIDTSQMMLSYQTTLANSLGNTINYFSSQGWDFHISVVGTDAYMADPTLGNYSAGNAGLAQFKDGGATTTGVFDINAQTPNLLATVAYNAQPGQAGNNDDRAFSSFRTALTSNLNPGFLRSTSFMPILILSNQDDFSGNGRGADVLPQHSYTDPNLDAVTVYTSFLDSLTNTTGTRRRYNISSINIQDSTCQGTVVANNPYAIIGLRLQQIVQDTGGVLGSLCDANYVTDLTSIAAVWGTMATQVYLNYTPKASSLGVTVNGSVIPQNAANGWQYDSAANSVQFFGSAVPAYGAAIAVTYNTQ